MYKTNEECMLTEELEGPIFEESIINIEKRVARHKLVTKFYAGAKVKKEFPPEMDGQESY